MGAPSISMITEHGSVSAFAEKDVVIARVSHDWRGRIWSDGELEVYRERSPLGRVLARLKQRFCLWKRR